MKKVRWDAPKVSSEIDRRAVVNQEQSHRLLLGVRRTTPELEAFSRPCTRPPCGPKNA